MQPRAAHGGAGAASGLPNVLLLATMDAGESADGVFYPSGKPYNARELLLAGRAGRDADARRRRRQGQ